MPNYAINIANLGIIYLWAQGLTPLMTTNPLSHPLPTPCGPFQESPNRPLPLALPPPPPAYLPCSHPLSPKFKWGYGGEGGGGGGGGWEKTGFLPLSLAAALCVYVSEVLLPGPGVTLPPFPQKNSAIWQEKNWLKIRFIFAYIFPLIPCTA